MDEKFLLMIDPYSNMEEFSVYNLKKVKGMHDIPSRILTNQLMTVLLLFLNNSEPFELLLNLFGLDCLKAVYESITKKEFQTKFKTKAESNNFEKEVIDTCKETIIESQLFFKDFLNKIYCNDNTNIYSVTLRTFRELFFMQDSTTNKKLLKKYETELNTNLIISTEYSKNNLKLHKEITKYYLQSDNLLTLFYAELKYLSRLNNFYINKCEYCGNYFRPTSRSDEKFCSRTYSNGTSCKSLGVRNNWKSILDGDEVRKIYNNLYQKKLMYCKRNSDDKDATIKFNIWKGMAKEVMKRYKQGQYSKDEVIQLLNQYEG